MIQILIVDDKRDNREILETFLKSHDYTVYSAENGKVALGILEKNPVDLIISDILMPEIDGYALCKEVKSDKRWADIPFVFYSETFTSRVDEIFAIKLGATKFIRKSTDPDEFLDIIQEILQKRKEGKLESAPLRFKDQKDIFRLYNQQIIEKLEEKSRDLEESEVRYRSLFENASI
jgi:CheY-like chemotaxis protein